MTSPGRYSYVRESRPDEQAPPPSAVPPGKFLGLVGYFLPVVFAAGSMVAGFKYLANETDRLNAKVEQLATSNAERDRRIQALESTVAGASRELDAAEKERKALEWRLGKLERNMAVVCTSRAISCEK